MPQIGLKGGAAGCGRRAGSPVALGTNSSRKVIDVRCPDCIELEVEGTAANYRGRSGGVDHYSWNPPCTLVDGFNMSLNNPQKSAQFGRARAVAAFLHMVALWQFLRSACRLSAPHQKPFVKLL
jgi:hypothetical protein